MDKEESRKKLNLPEDRKLVLFVGDPKNPVKRYSLAEKAVQLIAPSCKASLVAASGIAREKMPLYMNACDVFLMTSKHEGSPMVIKEAMSCNLPVVSVDVGDVRERLKNESNGIISGEDPAELAKNLEKILREDRRSEGRKAIQDCSLEAVAERLIKIYQAAVKGK